MYFNNTTCYTHLFLCSFMQLDTQVLPTWSNIFKGIDVKLISAGFTKNLVSVFCLKENVFR